MAARALVNESPSFSCSSQRMQFAATSAVTIQAKGGRDSGSSPVIASSTLLLRGAALRAASCGSTPVSLFNLYAAQSKLQRLTWGERRLVRGPVHHLERRPEPLFPAVFLPGHLDHAGAARDRPILDSSAPGRTL